MVPKRKKLYRHNAAKSSKRHSSSVAALKKHHKPFRVRHVSLLVVALLLGCFSLFQLGVYFGKAGYKTQPVMNSYGESSSRIETIDSSYGFTLSYDSDQLIAIASEVTKEGIASVPKEEFSASRPLLDIRISSAGSSVIPTNAAAELAVRVNESKQEFLEARSKAPGSLNDAQVAATMFEVSTNEAFEVTQLTQDSSELNNIEVIKRTYQYIPRFGNIRSRTYSVQWTGVLNDRAFSIHAQGLVNSTELPVNLQEVLDSLQFSSEGVKGDVLGIATSASIFGADKASAQGLNSKYTIEGVSPAVVKIYHATCGTLVAFNQQLGGESCNLTTGSGFFVSSTGYIATNGHVVDFSAEDAFIGVLLSNENTLISFLRDIVGMNNEQISALARDPKLLASLITEIYDLPANTVRIENESHTYFVALGEEPLEITDQKDAYDLRNRVDSHNLKKAKVIDTDYNSKDLYTVSSGDESGFSSSDVALLKVPVNDSPFLRFFEGTITQNMAISVVGFPGDAENLLTDNSSLSTSVTNGSISAIRDSAGGRYTLYQSDADASSGNSGGPALSAEGHVLGLLTYRFKNDAQQDAAKSYIRAIEDLKALARSNDIVFAQDGLVQQRWESGLNLYAQNRFSKALIEFEHVNDSYPAHRLAESYIANAKQAIAEGRDVKDFPWALVVAGTIGLIGMISAAVLVIKHHGHHQAYKLSQFGIGTHIVRGIEKLHLPTHRHTAEG